MDYEFDVFLSHNSKDKPAVEAIGRRLQETYGLKCWLDKWNLVPGEPWQEGLENALDASETVAVFLGPNPISPWENEEMRSALEERAQDASRRVIPVLLPGAPDSRDLKLPRFLKRLTWVDFRAGLHDEEALYRLCCGIKGWRPEPDGWKKKEEQGGLPHGSYIPFNRNALFTGREEDLTLLAENLLDSKATNTVISQAVTGMGGLGKTQLAVEFAYRYGHRFKGVHWLDLRDVSGLDGAIALCGNKMGYTQADQRELIDSTLKAWTDDGPRLLILDNFEDLGRANSVLARFQHPSLRLLVTSRRRDFPRSTALRVQKLGAFSEDESADFLEKTLERRETLEARKKLADKLGCLPLALEMAASYNNITKIGIEGYLKELADISRLEAEQAQWFKTLDVTNPTEHDQSLFGTFQLSWREVQEENQQKVFQIAGYLAPNTPIPVEIFKETLELEDKELSKALYRLNSLGLLPVAEDLPGIHPLLAAYARALSSQEMLEKLADHLSVLANRAIAQMEQTGNLGWFVPLRPHVISTANFAEEAGVPDAANLLSNLGAYLRRIADYQSAKSVNERALKISELANGPNHPDVATLVNNLGLVLQDTGDSQSARITLERALKIDETVLGSDHPNVARDLNNLGLILKDLGDLTGAKAALERARSIHEAIYGPDHKDVAATVNNLGIVLEEQGDLAGAKAAFEQALKIAEAAFGPNHPDVGTMVSNLGRPLQEQGDLTSAKAAFERALKIGEATLGPDHPNVARELNNLGRVLQELGDLAGAKTAFEQALKIDEAALGPNHPDVGTMVSNLGGVLQVLGNLAGAKAEFERALKIEEAAFGPNHPYVARDLNNLGLVLKDMGDIADAKAAFERALKIGEMIYGPVHPSVAIMVNNLGLVLQAQDDLTGAQIAYEQALGILRKFLPEGHPNIRIAQGNLDALSKSE